MVSAINFEYRGFDTVGEEFILFTAAAGMSVVLRKLRGEREQLAGRHAGARAGSLPPTSEPSGCVSGACRPGRAVGWWLASHAQANPSGGFQGGVILATAFLLVYLSGEFGYPPGERPPVPPGGAPDGKSRHRIGLAAARDPGRGA